MNYLVDTCVLAELTKPTPNKKVLDWVRGAPEHGLFLSVLSLGEIQNNITRLSRSKKKKALQAWIHNDLQRRFQGRILEITAEIALTWGKVQGNAARQGHIMPAVDSLIAATGLVHGLTVATRNAQDMERSGVKIVNLWVLNE